MEAEERVATGSPLDIPEIFAEYERAMIELRDTFKVRDTGRLSAQLQRLSAATDERYAVPRVYRGLELLSARDPGPVRRARFSTSPRIGPITWTVDGEQHHW